MAESHEITVYSAIICYNFQDGGNNIMISYVKPTISWSIFINKFFKILTHREVPYDIFINWKKQTKDIVNINQLQAYIDKNLYPPEEYDYEVKVFIETSKSMEFVLHAADELINIKKLDNDEYEFTTEHNYLFYSGKSFLKNLQIDNLQHYIDYCEEKQLFKIDMVNDDFILTLPIPFTNKNELIRMGKPDLDETQKLKKELEKKDKQIKNLQLLNSIITKKHDIIVDSLDNYRIDDDEISKLNEIVNEQREEISKLNNDLTGEKATVIALNNDLIAEQCKVKINPPNLNPKFHTLRLDLNRVCNYKIMSIDGEKYGDFLFEHYNLNGDSWRNIIESLQNYLKWQIVSGHFINRASDGSEYTAYLTFIEVYPLPISNKITKKYTNIMYEYDGIKNIYKLYFK